VPIEIERLYREHRAGLVRLVERELRDHQDAEDVVQTAFLDAQRALERGTIPRDPRAWLAAIALNAAHRLRRRRLKLEPLEEYAVQQASAMPEIRAALASLPREQRAAVLYRDLLGLSYTETAEQLGDDAPAPRPAAAPADARCHWSQCRVVAVVEAGRHAADGGREGRSCNRRCRRSRDRRVRRCRTRRWGGRSDRDGHDVRASEALWNRLSWSSLQDDRPLEGKRRPRVDAKL
jgi:RNA polymerase sigma-70 factor (ECF subfamily)